MRARELALELDVDVGGAGDREPTGERGDGQAVRGQLRAHRRRLLRAIEAAVEEAELGRAGQRRAEADAVQIGQDQRARAQRQVGLELVERAARVGDVAGAGVHGDRRAQHRPGDASRRVQPVEVQAAGRAPAGEQRRAARGVDADAGVEAAGARIDGAVGADGDAFARRRDAAQRDERGRELAVAGELDSARQMAAGLAARQIGGEARQLDALGAVQVVAGEVDLALETSGELGRGGFGELGNLGGIDVFEADERGPGARRHVEIDVGGGAAARQFAVGGMERELARVEVQLGVAVGELDAFEVGVDGVRFAVDDRVREEAVDVDVRIRIARQPRRQRRRQERQRAAPVDDVEVELDAGPLRVGVEEPAVRAHAGAEGASVGGEEQILPLLAVHAELGGGEPLDGELVVAELQRRDRRVDVPHAEEEVRTLVGGELLVGVVHEAGLGVDAVELGPPARFAVGAGEAHAEAEVAELDLVDADDEGAARRLRLLARRHRGDDVDLGVRLAPRRAGRRDDRPARRHVGLGEVQRQVEVAAGGERGLGQRDHQLLDVDVGVGDGHFDDGVAVGVDEREVFTDGVRGRVEQDRGEAAPVREVRALEDELAALDGADLARDEVSEDGVVELEVGGGIGEPEGDEPPQAGFEGNAQEPPHDPLTIAPLGYSAIYEERARVGHIGKVSVNRLPRPTRDSTRIPPL